ncbi:hypothetical protein [Neobacillus sp. PS2-9]|uniref:hypothetical protein n=1 Tax=Neobacillus sp. PS2-9 TaxID=3070676 RepID=UPI0027DFBC60|nr:hypothetical protein [Neobacillus sp. PS2-9]WML60022.1 hypothetical protein RCG25_09705 [Neobacillus sp. PS2-9]
MIVASDLDRTIIYSKRAMADLEEQPEGQLKLVEIKDGEQVAFMTEAALFALEMISQKSLFIPVTTRTTDQFNRLSIFKNKIEFKYAITTNGAVILEHGKPIEGWTEYVKNRLRMESALEEELLSIFQREGIRFDGIKKQAGKLFFYFILNSLPSTVEMQLINDLVGKVGWRISIQGRKLYFIPLAISKGSALEYLCQTEGTQAIAGAGDSILDWDFLQKCQYRFVPNQGELAKATDTSDLIFTKSRGVCAGEEILQQVLELLPLKV